MKLFRIVASLVSLFGIAMLIKLFVDWQTGALAMKYLPEMTHTAKGHWLALALGLPIPLHVIFIGLIVQKKWLTPSMTRLAWIGISTSGIWLGASVLYRML